MDENFVIINLKWFTGKERNYDTILENKIYRECYKIFLDYAYEKNITNKKIDFTFNIDDIPVLKKDITDLGLEFFKRSCFENWLHRHTSKDKFPQDAKGMNNCLLKCQKALGLA